MKNVLIIISICLLISCSNPTENLLILDLDDIPIVKGIAITNSNNVMLGIWNNPGYNLTFKTVISPKDNEQKKEKLSVQNNLGIAGIDGDDILPNGFGAGTPYPNPANGSIAFQFQIPRSVEVSIWIGPATLGTNTDEDITKFGDHIFLSENGTIIQELISQKVLNAGYYKYAWNTNDYAGNSAPSGFYRIYILLDKYLVYRDVFIANDYSDLPESMKAILNF